MIPSLVSQGWRGGILHAGRLPRDRVATVSIETPILLYSLYTNWAGAHNQIAEVVVRLQRVGEVIEAAKSSRERYRKKFQECKAEMEMLQATVEEEMKKKEEDTVAAVSAALAVYPSTPEFKAIVEKENAAALAAYQTSPEYKASMVKALESAYRLRYHDYEAEYRAAYPDIFVDEGVEETVVEAMEEAQKGDEVTQPPPKDPSVAV